MKILNGTIARPAIQCIHPESGKTGSWLFTGQSHKEQGAAVTPLFDDIAEVYRWAQANGWKPVQGSDAMLFGV